MPAQLPTQPIRKRFHLLNYCIDRFGYTKYLEIGCNKNQNFNRIELAYKIGVDPIKGGTMRMTSDAYFATTDDYFDLIFIDGLHECEQVERDVTNSLKHLKRDGTIVLHDCNPKRDILQARPRQTKLWNGDVWKALVHFRQDPELDIVVGDMDHGLGVIRRRRNTSPIRISKHFSKLTWKDLVKNRQAWLRLRTAEQLKAWLNG